MNVGMPVFAVRFTEQQLVVEPAASAMVDLTNAIHAVEKLGWLLEHFDALKRSGNQWSYFTIFRRRQDAA